MGRRRVPRGGLFQEFIPYDPSPYQDVFCCMDIGLLGVATGQAVEVPGPKEIGFAAHQ